jgi:hypothetical protein
MLRVDICEGQQQLIRNNQTLRRSICFYEYNEYNFLVFRQISISILLYKYNCWFQLDNIDHYFTKTIWKCYKTNSRSHLRHELS